MDEAGRITERHREIRQFLDWRDEVDGPRLEALLPVLEPYLPALVDDFYEEIVRHPRAAAVFTGGAEQVGRLKGSLHHWIVELLRTLPDDAYAARCWRVGRRHAELRLDPLYVIAAMGRLRLGLRHATHASWNGPPWELPEALHSLDRRLDFDLALIQDAYQAENDARLQRAERFATLGQVAGGLAHELRNPLNVVKTSVYYLLHARSPTAEKRAEHLRRIGRGVDRADAVITALSNFAKMPAPDLRPTPLCEAIAQALELDPPGPGIDVEVDCPGELAALVDPTQLPIVLGNLLRNAREAMHEGGSLTLRARRFEGRVEVDVIDTGVGMGPEQLARLAEPLLSTKARGLGLGLAISRAILEKNGGLLRVDSEPGRGTTFTVAFREAAEPPETEP